MKELLYLEMGGNSYNSAVPAGIASLPELEALYLDDCDLEGDLSFILDLEASSIYEIWLDGNPALGGRIPTEIGDHTKLASLSISNCALTGPIPSEIGRLSDMEQIWVYGNNLEGEIPSEIGNLDRLKTLQVEDNPLLYGNMPDEICALRDVTPGLLALGSDCDSGDVTCDCCTCCEAPCSVVVGRRHLMEASYWI
jgi:Leucine-rich repeat (LRR) protein